MVSSHAEFYLPRSLEVCASTPIQWKVLTALIMTNRFNSNIPIQKRPHYTEHLVDSLHKNYFFSRSLSK